MPDNIELSGVMGTYNRLHMLKRVIPKILSSGSSINMEIIINDGGSTDGTIEWLNNISSKNPRIVPIFSGKLDGITNAYNQCFMKAKGKFVTWLSDDTIPVGNSLVKMCNFMKILHPKDLGAFLFRNSAQAPFAVPKIKGFYSPAVACVYRETLEKMNYWNTDFPYYGQDNEFDARILRLGGKIAVCKDASIDHLNHQDNLKKTNVAKYSQQGHGQKFQIIYFTRYGIRSQYEYPVMLIIPADNTPKAKVIDTIKNVHSHYENMNYHVVRKVGLEDIDKELDYVKIIDPVPRPGWSNFDLIVSINQHGKTLFNFDGTENKMKFGQVLLK